MSGFRPQHPVFEGAVPLIMPPMPRTQGIAPTPSSWTTYEEACFSAVIKNAAAARTVAEAKIAAAARTVADAKNAAAARTVAEAENAATATIPAESRIAAEASIVADPRNAIAASNSAAVAASNSAGEAAGRAALAALAVQDVDGHFVVSTPHGQFRVEVCGGALQTDGARLVRQMKLDEDCFIAEMITAADYGSRNFFLSVYCADRTNDTERFVASLLLQPYTPILTTLAIEQPAGSVVVTLTEEYVIWNAADVRSALNVPADTILSALPSAIPRCQTIFLSVHLATMSIRLPMTFVAAS